MREGYALYSRYISAGMKQAPWRIPETQIPDEARLTLRSKCKGKKHIGLLGPPTIYTDLRLAYIIRCIEREYAEELMECKSHNIGYFKPMTDYQAIHDTEQFHVAIFNQVDKVPPIQIASMRALLASMLMEDMPIIVTAESKESLVKAIGTIAAQLEVMFKAQVPEAVPVEVEA